MLIAPESSPEETRHLDLVRLTAALVTTVLTLGATSVARAAEPPRDSDEDEIPDAVERRTGTDPFHRDTDRDGVADGVEDANQDGKEDADESNPRLAGLFPGTTPHIPEPMVFDLVRGLGARRNELEVNTLGLVERSGGRSRFLWAPEVEWAFLDGYAIELELPLVDRHLEAVKLAVQGTLPWRDDHTIMGWQVFGEVGLDHGASDVVAVYLLGHRFNRVVSSLLMVGGRGELEPGSGLTAGAFIQNGSLFFDVEEWLTTGIESNFTLVERRDWSLQLYPQTHWQLSQSVRVQFSGGVGLSPEGVMPIWGGRVILE